MTNIGDDPKNFVNQTYAIAREVDGMAATLEHIASALSFVGMEKLTRDLEKVADVLHDDAEQLRNVVSDKVSQDVRASEQATVETLKVAFAISNLHAEKELAEAKLAMKEEGNA